MRRLVSWSIAGFVALGMAAVACGGATSTDLLDSPSGDGGAASSGSTSSGSSGSTSSSSSGSTSSSSSGSTSSSSSGSTSSSSSSSSSGGDAGPTAKIKCGSSFCTPGTQVCCRKPGLPNEYNCTAPNACNSAGSLTIPCDDATDCSAAGQPGTVCCGRTASAVDSRITKIACEKPANCTGDQAAIVCDPTLPSSGQCPVTGTTCKSSVVSLPDYNLCLR